MYGISIHTFIQTSGHHFSQLEVDVAGVVSQQYPQV